MVGHHHGLRAGRKDTNLPGKTDPRRRVFSGKIAEVRRLGQARREDCRGRRGGQRGSDRGRRGGGGLLHEPVRDPRGVARQGALRLGGELGFAVSGAVRVALPPARLRPADAASGGAQRRRRRRRDGDQLGGVAGRNGDEPFRGRLLPGTEGGGAGGGVGLRGDLRLGGVPGLPREDPAGRRRRWQLQCQWTGREEILASGVVGPAQLSLLHGGVRR